jgi:5-methylcytosine-specific restriction endonuclease McrA
VLIVLFLISPAAAEDKEDCLMCHKYRYLGRISEDGQRYNYNVDEHIYSKSIHRIVPCRDCHTTITKIPHDPVTEEVNCANVCHVKPPFAQEYFSHEKIIAIYKSSAHGIKPEDPPAVKSAKPYCKFCHLNPLYTRVEEAVIDYDKTLKRCLNCHRQKGVTAAYMHVTHRLRKKTSRSPQEIVALCAKCHEDKEMMQKLNVSSEELLAVETYNRSIHGKSVMLGSDQTADCISCHASSALHDIYKKENPKATINSANLQSTCKQCHEKTNNWFAQIAVHPRIEREKDPIVYFASIFFRLALYGSLFSMVGLMLLETYGRKKDGIKTILRRGTTWRGKSKRR